MIDFILTQIFFYFSIVFVLFIPGYYVLRLLKRSGINFSGLEQLFISCAISIGITDLLLIILHKSNTPINRWSTIIALGFFTLLVAVPELVARKKKEATQTDTPEAKNDAFSFSKQQSALIVIIFILTIFIRTIYLENTIFPHTTDMGHHMYWVEKIVKTGKIPDYEKVDIVKSGDGFAISSPQPISDFIIGEHLPFAAVNIISGVSVVSHYPALILFLVNVVTLIGMFSLAVRLFAQFPFGKNAAIIALFLIGPLYAMSSAQTKFVSGGVIGNIIGNLLITAGFYLFFRALQEKNKNLFLLGSFTVFILLYTHHLSAFIFIFCVAAFLLLSVLARIGNMNDLKLELSRWKTLVFSAQFLIFALLAGTFIFFFFSPTYITNNSVETVIGEPTKSTKQGFSFTELSFIAGEVRMALGIVGLFILALFHKKKTVSALLLGWTAVIFLMSWKPGLLHINIPSVRIANYLAFPISLAASFAIGWIFHSLQKSKQNFILPKFLILIIFFSAFAFSLAGGLKDNSLSLEKGKPTETEKVFHAASYLAQVTTEDDVILKDHNYLASDSWMKIFFMKDYNYPFTRSFFFRYEENKNREQCTLLMISNPETDEAEKCFTDTRTDFLVVNANYDSGQFKKLDNFWQVYANDTINIFYRKYAQ